ncbi:MAG: CYTH and CHAD domain-containing protein [Actinomycetota bacterium]
MTASTEREVKLAASAAFRMPSLDGLGDDVLTIPHDAQRLLTVYFDTPDFRLARWGVSLRHREGQGWTTKLPAEDGGGDLLIRGEFAFPGEEATTPPDEAIDLIRAYVRTATLRPVVRLRTIRRMIQLLDLDDRLLGEVVDDEVSVLSGRRIAARFRELEVEITEDTPEGLLDEVLERLRAAGAGAPDPTPKYVRAVGPPATQPPEVEVSPLMPAATVIEVVSRTLAVSVVHILRHDVVMRLDADPEGVHRARVATRRLRSDLRTFRAMLDPEWAEPLREELRWLGTVLGEARDADVLLARLQGRIEMIPPTEAPGVAQVIEALQQRRKEAHTALLGSICSERYVGLLDRLVEAARRPVVLPDMNVPVRGILADVLGGPWRHLRGAAKEVGKRPGDVELHTVRIRAKRVRYAADAVAPILGKPALRFAGAAAELQEILGEHNDAVVAGSWLRTWAAGRRSGDAAFAAGMLAGIERAAANDAQGRWCKAWKSVVAAREAM